MTPDLAPRASLVGTRLTADIFEHATTIRLTDWVAVIDWMLAGSVTVFRWTS